MNRWRRSCPHGGHAGSPIRGIFTSAGIDAGMKAFSRKHGRLASRPYGIVTL